VVEVDQLSARPRGGFLEFDCLGTSWMRTHLGALRGGGR
jgi:hypothetical protein